MDLSEKKLLKNNKFLFQMAKRKMDCSLDEIVGTYLKKKKCENSLLLFEERVGHRKNYLNKTLQDFIGFLKKKESERENMKLDNLGFEINFGAYQPATNVSSIGGDRGKGKKKERNSFEDIPRGFIKKIKKLGMKEEDADILYRTKIDWTAVYSNNKIFCTEKGCDFYTKLDNDDLKNHMINDHCYGNYPCAYAHCNFVAYSKGSLNRHSAMHTRRFEKQYWNKCSRPGCKSSFQFEYDLAIHLRIHENDVHACRYCPYIYVKPLQYKRHLKVHFRIKDCECDQCDLKFATITELIAIIRNMKVSIITV